MNDVGLGAVASGAVSQSRVWPIRPEDEFRALFLATFPSVARTVHLLVGDRAMAEEITQDSFVQLLTHWRKVSRYERPDLWVRRVAIRRAQRERHRRWRRGELERSIPPIAVVDAPAEPDGEVRAAVDTLPPKQRAVVVLFYFEDRPMDEIAELLDCSMSTGWSQLYNARRKLAVLLAEEEASDVD